MRKYALLYAFVFSFLLMGQTTLSGKLDNELKSLDYPAKAPQAVEEEKLYAVQTRNTPLAERFEFHFGGAKNFSPGSYLVSGELDFTGRYYFSDRWFTSLNGSYVTNDLSADGDRLWKLDQKFPDISCVKYRIDGSVGYNLFYGKIRVSMDQVFYFDQYLAAGGGMINVSNGIDEEWTPALTMEAALAFRFDNNWSATLSLKDYFFKDYHRFQRDYVQHFVGALALGYLL